MGEMKVFPFFVALIGCIVTLSGAVADGPEATRLSPPGGQRGQSVAVVAVGKFPTWPCQVWIDEPGLTFEPQTDNGKFQVTIAPDAIPGLRKIRFYDAAGVSPVNRFVIGTVPEIPEVEPNNGIEKAHKVESLPIVVNAAIQKRADVDVFSVQVKAGQMLVAALDGNRTLKSPMDAVMQLLDARGFVLAQNLDARGLDPQIRFTAKQDGDLLVRVFSFPEQPDTSIGYAGGENYVYRLTLSTSGLVEAAWPLALPSSLEPPKLWDSGVVGDPLQVGKSAGPAIAFHPAIPGTVELPIGDGSFVGEGAANELPELAVPSVASGRIATDGERDGYRFKGTKGTRYAFQVDSRSLGFPLDSVLEIQDASGKRLAREDDAGAQFDSKMVWAAPEDGEYRVVVFDVHQLGGADFYYRLRFDVERPDYKVMIKADSFTAKLNEPLEIPVEIARTAGFDGELKIAIEGLPEHVTCDAVVSPGTGDASKSVKLVLKATQAFVGPVRIVAAVDGKPETRRVAKVADDSPEQVFVIAK
jgi:hypothetical protein